MAVQQMWQQKKLVDPKKLRTIQEGNSSHRRNVNNAANAKFVKTTNTGWNAQDRLASSVMYTESKRDRRNNSVADTSDFKVLQKRKDGLDDSEGQLQKHSVMANSVNAQNAADKNGYKNIQDYLEEVNVNSTG